MTTHNFAPAEGASALTCGEVHFKSGVVTIIRFTIAFAYIETTNCHFSIFGNTYPTDVRENGCRFEFHISAGSSDEYTGTWDIACPTGKSLEIEQTTLGGGTKKCLYTIGSQVGLNNITYQNNTAASPTDLLVAFNTNNVKNTSSGGLLNCGLANGEHTTGTYTGASTLRAYNGSGTQIDFTVM